MAKVEEQKKALGKTELDKLLTSVYHDPSSPGSFGGVNSLLTQVNELLLQSNRPKVRRPVVEEWLRDSEAYTTHRSSTDKFKRNPIKVNYVNEIWECDVIFYPDLASFNKGYSYVLAVLDTASRFLFVRFLYRKSCPECLAALKSIIKEAGVKPKFLMSDRGTEFLCNSFTNYLEEQNIKPYQKMSGDVKTSHLDRAVRTIQQRLHTLFSALETRDLLTNLPKLVHSYNHSVNRSIGMTPAQAQTEPGRWHPGIDKRQQQQFPEEKVKVRKGQYVRILGQKAGHHAYKGNWTFEVYKVDRVKRRPGRRIQYYLVDMRDKEITGAFYAEELQLVKRPDRRKQYKIESVESYKKMRGKRYALVKWAGLDESQNSWVLAKEVKNLKA
jgi:hypothetical protein